MTPGEPPGYLSGDPQYPHAQPPYHPPYPPPHPPYPYGYGYAYGYPPADRRPGTLTAAAVLAFVAGGLLVVAGIELFAGASMIASLDSILGTNYTAELALDGVVDLAAAGLLIAGGVALLGGRPAGRSLYGAATAIVLVATLYWIARWGAAVDTYAPFVLYGLMFSALVVIGVCLAWARDASAWLARRAAGWSGAYRQP